MSISGICAYLIRALAFAAAMGAIYCLALRICKKRVRKMGLLCIMYLSAVTEIIALRFGMPPVERELQLVPLQTTLSALQAGAWPFIYHVGGNLAWFVPLGVFIQLRFPDRSPLGALLSAALEALQFALSTGMTDIDDVLLNALGALLGACAVRILRRQGLLRSESPALRIQ